MKPRVFALTVVVVLAGLIGYRLMQKQGELRAETSMRAARMKAPPVVGVSMPRRQDIAQTFESVGSVEAPLSVKIASKITGRIEYLAVQEGDRVSQGQVLVRIDPTEVEAQVRQARAALAEQQYRLAQARITQNPTEVSVASQVRQQEAALRSAQADYNQVKAGYQAEVETAEAAVANRDAEVRSAQANLENAQARYARVQELYKQGFIAAQDVDDAKTAVGVAQSALDGAISQRTAAERQLELTKGKGLADIEAAAARLEQVKAALASASANTAEKAAYRQSLAALQASVEVAQAGVKSAEARRADTVLRAPLTGFVTARSLDPGSVVTASQPILTVQYMRRVWVTVSVPEEASGRISLGQQATVSLDALPGRTLAGRIIQVNPSADPESRQFAVRVALDNPDFAIKPGSYAHVQIATGTVRSALVVPREAIQRDREGSYVMVVDEGGVAHRRAIATGTAGVDVIAITSGLSPRDKVVILAAMPLRDGQVVSTGGRRGGRSVPAGNPPGKQR